ncbi:ribosome maturation factor RimP [Peptacetobacter sp.]|uniref:ribosome maturation factor RimP n=1 Tax=Peptacetobacter sp. TaxID=2991975 RepID=UPI0026265F07|nr:ribosome maturation factor RimP [Peptacetobacter sp.]
MRKNEIVAKVEEFVTAITDEKGFETVDVEYVKEAGQYYLRVYIDKEGGISLNECEEVSRELSPKLDENDFIEENYYLEVSSPGIDRALKRDKEFVKYKGRDVEIKLYKAIDGVKQFEGELVGLDDENNIVVIINNEEVKFNRKDVAIIRLAIKF